MKKAYVPSYALFTFYILSTCFTVDVHAQTEASTENTNDLYRSIAKMDSLLFTAFNNRNLETVKTIFSKDLEFFHDQGGLSYYEENITNTKSLFDKDNGLTRTLVPGSLEVHPIPNYGAIQIGRHEFCHPENGKMDCGTFKFVHIWKKVGETWELTRVVSYGH